MSQLFRFINIANFQAANQQVELAVAEKFKRGFLDVLECRCWSSRHNSSTPGIPAHGADTRYIIATGRRTTALQISSMHSYTLATRVNTRLIPAAGSTSKCRRFAQCAIYCSNQSYIAKSSAVAEGRSVPLEILPTAAQLYYKLHLKNVAIGE